MVLPNVGHYAPNRPVKIGLRQIIQVQKTDLDLHIMNHQTIRIFFFSVNKDFRKHKNPIFTALPFINFIHLQINY